MRGRMLVHEQTHKEQNDPERKFQCQECGKSFAEVGSLQSHEKIHSKDNYIDCPKCGITYSKGSGRFNKHLMQCADAAESIETRWPGPLANTK